MLVFALLAGCTAQERARVARDEAVIEQGALAACNAFYRGRGIGVAAEVCADARKVAPFLAAARAIAETDAGAP